MAVKEFWKSLHICQSYDKKIKCLVFLRHSVDASVNISTEPLWVSISSSAKFFISSGLSCQNLSVNCAVRRRWFVTPRHVRKATPTIWFIKSGSGDHSTAGSRRDERVLKNSYFPKSIQPATNCPCYVTNRPDIYRRCRRHVSQCAGQVRYWSLTSLNITLM